ncbi:hypothetical protein [Phenylobacterium sp.]|uniref:hypothetical protein n=1 Tax=Phenylobacterium sp. TaxID=1871053 RepID=UPI0025FCCDE8|nr:hypothetical protein [Phenylobacterium sp.]
MAKPPQDPRVTDLASYKKAREQARRKPAPKPPGASFLGSNPRAGAILILVIVVVAALYVVPRFLH